MKFRLMALVMVGMCVAAQAVGFEVLATIEKLDAESRVAVVFANGQHRTVAIASNVTLLNEDGSALAGGLVSPDLKPGSRVTLTVERVGNAPAILGIRLGGMAAPPEGAASVGRPTVGMKPLTEMTAEDRYKGEDGGLYGGGRNEPPETHAALARNVTASIAPLDANGAPAADGVIGLVSISMSNATQEYSRFKQLADEDADVAPHVEVVDCAQGGQTMARWADAKALCWDEAERRLARAEVSREQVQVVWVKLANAGPSGDLQSHGKQLEQDTQVVLANLVSFFPNLKIAYLGSRVYGGYADGRLNPEPYAYEGAFVVRWLIQRQFDGDADLNFDATRGEVQAPLLLWGPYFWGDGTTPRAGDGLTWQRSDFVADGTHPSQSGRQKVAEQLLTFFKTDPMAKTWFLASEN
jgi:hypothetical protein